MNYTNIFTYAFKKSVVSTITKLNDNVFSKNHYNNRKFRYYHSVLKLMHNNIDLIDGNKDLNRMDRYENYTNSKISSLDNANNSHTNSSNINSIVIPQHIGFIVDGNGRWAKERNLTRLEGHSQGAKVTVDIVKEIFSSGVSYITLYLFSTENWSRPNPEILNIFELLNNYLNSFSNYLIENEIELHVIGEIHRLPIFTQQLLQHTGYQPMEHVSTNHHRRVLCLAISYGGRQDITQSCRRLMTKVQNKEMSLEDISEDLIGSETYLGRLGIPDPDLIVRTSGEFRLSNFLLWQASYTELLSIQCYWPDFSNDMVREILQIFGNRQRRFGNII